MLVAVERIISLVPSLSVSLAFRVFFAIALDSRKCKSDNHFSQPLFRVTFHISAPLHLWHVCLSVSNDMHAPMYVFPQMTILPCTSVPLSPPLSLRYTYPLPTLHPLPYPLLHLSLESSQMSYTYRQCPKICRFGWEMTPNGGQFSTLTSDFKS